MADMMDWEELETAIVNCRQCPRLNVRGKTQSAPGYGNKTSSIMLIGQSLCGPCMATQIPFTGGSGKILDAILRKSGIGAKANVFTTNIVKCHPERNRASTPLEIKTCTPFLLNEIALLKPRIVFPLGLDATKAFLGGRITMRDTAYQRYTNGEYTLYPMYHPAYFLRTSNRIRTVSYIKRFVEIIGKIMEEEND